MSTGNRTLEVILTHEHTDFDALASMLAASIIFPEATPVLPHQLNRNVQEFLVLHKDELPFVIDSDMPKGRIARAVLVDANSVNWIKGMDRDTELIVIDHHDESTDEGVQTSEWSDQVGANTTLLVEQLIEREYNPTPVEATLLALGIHEDTGSLIYPSTTYRDVRCLAWLMRPLHNVNMEVLAHFLNHPLSREQRELLHTLIDSSEFLDISGHNVVVAQAQASGFRDELSALASRLRDFHETDAVFLIVDLGDIVQVVARSTTDDIDVGEIARALGGGGHTRAAAAPLQDAPSGTHGVRDQIIRLVEELSRSAQTVRHIMSAGRPQTVSPKLATQEAFELMQRYGHEGFPVVQKRSDGSEELLGILTRRQTDRAINHGLGHQPVSRFMRSGQVTVQPSDSIHTLRRKMVDNNWGQVPVIDENNRIIGIVTRTDLIKLWDERESPQRRADDVERRLRTRLAPAQYSLLHLIGSEVDKLGYTVYVVGGFVRDLILGKNGNGDPSPDVDIVIEGDAIQFANHMRGLYGGRVVPHQRFNTAKWLLSDDEYPVDNQRLLADLDVANGIDDIPSHLDFVSARTEFYTAPTALPTVETSSIKLDLHRRDFTINTLAICLNPDRRGELLDFYGGLDDLNRGVVRVLHSLSFIDDPTRIMRAVRYEQRFGFHIEPRTMELLQDALPLIDRISGARLRHELERILGEEVPELSLLRLTELEALQRLHPDLVADEWVQQRFELLRTVLASSDVSPVMLSEPSDHLYWGLLCFRLPKDAHDLLTERLGLRGAVQRLTKDLAHIHSNLPTLSRADLLPSQVASILDKVNPLSVAEARIACHDSPAIMRWLDLYETTYVHIQPVLNGNDLYELGLRRGPLFSRILTSLRAARLDGLVHDRQQEMALVSHLARGELQCGSS